MTIKSDEDFINWLEEQPPSIADGVLKNNTDAKWASRVLDLYKPIKVLIVHQNRKTLLLLNMFQLKRKRNLVKAKKSGLLRKSDG